MLRSKVLLCGISAVLILALLPGCGAQRGYSGYLRGDELLYLRLPIQDGRRESIVLGKQHLASRSFDPVTIQTHINRVMIPESLWTDLENLRHTWCSQPPSEAARTPSDTDFVIVFQCGKVQNPVNAVEPPDLPQPLRALIDLVPSTSERLIVP
jgi:hypothetical protein